MYCTRLAEHTEHKNDAKNAIYAPSYNLSGCVFATKARINNGKNLLSSNFSSRYPHNMVNFDPLTAEIGSGVWGTPANFNGFRVLPSLLQRRRSPEANQTLHNAWPSPGLVHSVYILGGCCPLTEFCPVQNSLYVQVLRSPILAALLHGTHAVFVSETLRRWAEGAPIFGRAAITSWGCCDPFRWEAGSPSNTT